MTLSILFLAQATNTPLTIWQELGILGIATITSKGASGVTGAGFITLAATLAIVPDIPIQALAILVGIDKFMSECPYQSDRQWRRDRRHQLVRRRTRQGQTARSDGASDKDRRRAGTRAKLAARGRKAVIAEC
jgi:hypothetical protein